MLTVIFIAAGLIFVIGLVVLALRSGQQSVRHDKASDAVVNKQQISTNPRASVRSSGSAND